MSRWALSWLLVFAAAVLVTWKAAQSETAKDADAELYRLFVDALEHVDRSYVKEVDRRELIESAINGMLEKLDPYSTFIPPKEFDNFSRSTTGKFGGVGIQVRPKQKEDPFLSVLTPVVGTPAYEAGVLANDRILSVDGHAVAGMTQNEVVEKLTGEPGTAVKISVLHEPYEQPAVDIELKRALINIESILGDQHKPDDSWNYFVDEKDKIAYIRISSFMQETASDLRKALEKLKAEGVRGIILDLRDNPGGLLSSAIEVCDLFLKQGVIVSTKGRNTQDKVYSASGDAILPDVPLVILANGWSASASEIVSGCLQDHGRAVVIGERTFGKGSVQNVIELDDGKSALKLTTASYRRPNGKNIHRFNDSKIEDDWGVRPNDGYELKMNDDEHRAFAMWRNERDRIHGKPQPATPPAEQKAEPAKEEKPAEPAEPAAEKPAEPKAEKPADAPAAEKPAEPAVVKPTEQKADKPAEPAADKPKDEAAPKEEPKAEEKKAEEKKAEDATPAVKKDFHDLQLEKGIEYLRQKLAEPVKNAA